MKLCSMRWSFDKEYIIFHPSHNTFVRCGMNALTGQNRKGSCFGLWLDFE